MSQSNSNNNDEDNAILHASLLRGTLSIKATDMDIRRNEEGGVLSSLVPIETDYILKVESTNKVKFSESSNGRLSVHSQQIQEFEEYHCSKRYVDMRNLASAMRGHAEDICKYYHLLKDSPSKTSTNKEGSGGKGGRKRATVFGALEKVLLEPVKVVQYITNSEPKSSNLVSDLDSIFSDDTTDHSPKGRQSWFNTGSSKSTSTLKRRTSEFLDQGAPLFVREAIIGADEFYEAIYSEKRQFRHKSNYDHVKSVAERRMKIVNSAFSLLINALSNADLESVSKRDPGSIPVPLQVLVRSLEKFLLTDVIVEEGEENDAGLVKEETMTPHPLKRAVPTAPPQHSESDSSISNSRVMPQSTRRRASIVVREEEVKKCMAVVELVMTDSVEEKDHPKADSAATDEGEGVPVITETGLLPDHPIDFGLVVAIGAILFKSIEGQAVVMQMDMLVVFAVACALIGYRLARPSVVYVKKGKGSNGISSDAKRVTIDSQATPAEKDKTEERTVPARNLEGRRSMLQKSTGHMDLKNSMRRNSLHLIQASIQSVRHVAAVEDKAEEKPIIPAKTFDKFPDGAAIGAHLNCWSSPPSANFKVRGPNYLKDKKKVPSGDYLFPCRGCDLFLTDNPPVNVGRNHSILNGKLRDVPTFIINYRLPWGVFLSYHEIPERFLPFLRRGHGHGDTKKPLPSMANMPAGERAMCNFLLSDTDEKNQIWKIVPMVVEGPWVVKRVVGGKPAIVGTKMPIDYVYQPPEKGLAEYLEADLDIVSSAAARNILAVVRSYTQTLTIDLGYVVQGNKDEELPEQMMLGLRLHGLDPLTAELLPEFDDGMVVPELDDDTGYDTE